MLLSVDDVTGVGAHLHALWASTGRNAPNSLTVLRGHHFVALSYQVACRGVDLSYCGAPGAITDLDWRFTRDFYRVRHPLFSVIAATNSQL